MRLIHAGSLVRIQAPLPLVVHICRNGFEPSVRIQAPLPYSPFWAFFVIMVSVSKIKTKINTKMRQLNYKTRHDFLTIENVVLGLAIILCLVWTYQSIAAMSRNWELSERLTTERKNLELTSIEVEMAELENEYYKTNEYQELVARRNLDKKLPGENMVVMPENSDAAKTKHEEVDAIPISAADERSNFEKWMTYLFPVY